MDLEFGTAGLRGIIGAGINRMNIYTVRRATQGLANYIIKQGGSRQRAWPSPSIPDICPRSLPMRQHCTLAANGIKAYKFESLRPTPELSFAVRELRLHRRHQHYRKPQPAGVQRLQGILGGRRTVYTAA